MDDIAHIYLDGGHKNLQYKVAVDHGAEAGKSCIYKTMDVEQELSYIMQLHSL